MSSAPTVAAAEPLTEPASGIDALYLSGRGHPRPGVVDALEDIRGLAVQVNQPLPKIIDNICWTVSPHSWGKYRYCIDHPSARIGLTTSAHLPPYGSNPDPSTCMAAAPPPPSTPSQNSSATSAMT